MLSVQNIRYSVDGHLLLDDISMEIPQGSFVGLIGPNGSGKSTLLKTIYRVNKSTSGAVYLNGTDMSRMTGREIARQMAVVTQENQVNFDFSVMEIMMIGLYAKRSLLAGDSPEDVAACEKVLSAVGMHKGTMDRFLNKLEVLRKLTAEGVFSFNPDSLNEYLSEYEAAGYPAVSHSEKYRQAYKPSYRIINTCWNVDSLG